MLRGAGSRRRDLHASRRSRGGLRRDARHPAHMLACPHPLLISRRCLASPRGRGQRPASHVSCDARPAISNVRCGSSREFRRSTVRAGKGRGKREVRYRRRQFATASNSRTILMPEVSTLMLLSAGVLFTRGAQRFLLRAALRVLRMQLARFRAPRLCRNEGGVCRRARGGAWFFGESRGGERRRRFGRRGEDVVLNSNIHVTDGRDG